MAGRPASVLVPANDDLGLSWTGSPADEPFDDSPGAGWTRTSTGIGFDVVRSEFQPLAYWTFDDPEDSETALDVSGNERHGNIVSQFDLTGSGGRTKPVYTAAELGHSGTPEDHALDFGTAANGAVVTVPSASSGAFDSIAANNQVTISLWIHGNTSQPANDFLLWASDQPAGNGIRSLNAHAPWGDGTIYWDTGGCCDTTQRIFRAEPDTDLWRGRWNHYVFIKRGDVKEIWQNGRLFHSDSNTAPITAIRSFSIGDRTGGSGASYAGLIDDVAVWDTALEAAAIGALAQGASPLDLSSYTPLIAEDLESDMYQQNSSAYLRLRFDADDVADAANLTLRMKYDDGFVAFLNGTEIARANAPADLTFDASALSVRARQDAVRFHDFDITPALDQLHDTGNVLAIHGLNASRDDEDFLVLPELVATARLGERYLSVPTPGGANVAGVVDFVADTSFSVDRGFYDKPFQVEITTLTEDAEIYYTLDGSEPEPGSPTASLYAGPISVAKTTLLRAAAYKDGHAPTNVDTQTYVFLDDVAVQPAAPPGFPTVWSGGAAADYEVDPEVVNAALPTHGIRDALLAIPSVSIVSDHDRLFGADEGIYYNSSQKREQPASIEFLAPADGRSSSEESFQINAGIRIHGLTSRRHSFTPKHSVRVNFKSRYGPRKLLRRLFPDTRVDRFDQFVLKGLSTDTWPVEDGWNLGQVPGARRWYRERATYQREQAVKDSFLAMGQPAAHGYFVHVFLNGLYWGVYNLTERCTDSFHAEHFGGEREEFDVIRDFAELHSGDKRAWDAMMSLAANGFATDAELQRIQGNHPDGTRNPAYPRYLDVDNLIDYMILHICVGADDWPAHNWWAGRRRGDASEGFRFYPWDQEISNNDNNFFGWTSWGSRFELVNNDNSPAFLYDRLRRNPTFQRRFGDRVHKHLFNDGALTPEASDARWQARRRELDQAIVGESARWGDRRRTQPYTREGDWLVEQAWIETYWQDIRPLQLERFRRVQLYPPIEAPVFSRHGGRIEPGFALGMVTPSGVIYYTVDGSDPSLPSGAPSPNALEFSGFDTAVLFPPTVLCRYHVPLDDSLGNRWQQPDFDDGDWAQGAAIGFDTGSDYDALIDTDVETLMHEQSPSIFLRIPFRVDEEIVATSLNLRVQYDDGFVAYLNGVEIARRNAPGTLSWDTPASASHADNQAIQFEFIDLTAFRTLLQNGDNVPGVPWPECRRRKLRLSPDRKASKPTLAPGRCRSKKRHRYAPEASTMARGAR